MEEKKKEKGNQENLYPLNYACQLLTSEVKPKHHLITAHLKEMECRKQKVSQTWVVKYTDF
jgi:hypothetical protein